MTEEEKDAPQYNGKSYLLAFLAAMLLAAFVLLPIPYYIELPGSSESLKGVITVNKKEDQAAGEFMFTTVAVKGATPVTALLAKVRSFQDLYAKKELMGNSTTEEYDLMQEYYMTSSQNTAVQVAMEAAKKKYKVQYKGVYVMALTEESNFSKDLTIGDTIYAVDGQTFQNSEEFMRYVKNQSPGQSVTIQFLHKGKEKRATAKLITLKGEKKAGIGISPVDHTEIETEIPVKFHTDSVGGPSAGLMFALETYSMASGEDLRKGKKISGTGTIDSNGQVGPIGGIDKKVVAADKAGAEIFFAPQDEITPEMKKIDPDLESNYITAVKAAKKLKTKMKIVPVKTFQDALQYLERLS